MWALGRGIAHPGADLHGKPPSSRRGLSLSHTAGYGLRQTTTEIVPATLQTSALPLGYGAGASVGVRPASAEGVETSPPARDGQRGGASAPEGSSASRWLHLG